MNALYDTLTAALQELGCDPQRFSFDTHSTVVMNFRDVGELLIDPMEEGVAVWGHLPLSVRNGFGADPAGMLAALSEPVDYLHVGALTLRQEADACLVGGVLHPSCLRDAGLLAAAIERFHAAVLDLQGRCR